LEVVLPLVFVMIALGECLLTPVMGPLVIDLAPRDLIGRYSGTVAATTSAAMLVGAPLGAWVALAAPPTAYWLVLAAGAAALAVVVRTASWESPILTRHSPRLLGTGTAPFHG
jgi:predicted MFS family arabinose efflux permease